VADQAIETQVRNAESGAEGTTRTITPDAIRNYIRSVADQTVETQVRNAESGAEGTTRTITPDAIRNYIRAVAEQAVETQVRNAESGVEGTPTRTVAPDAIRNYIRAVADQAVETQVRNAELTAEMNGRIRTVPDPRGKLTSLIVTEIVEGMPYLQENGRPRVIASVGVTDKYDETHLDNEVTLRSNETVSFGHAFTEMFQSTKKGKQLMIDYFSPKVAESLQAQRVKTVIDPSSSEAEKTKSMYEAVTSVNAFEMTARLLGSIGDMMDVFGTVMLFTDAFYMNDRFQDYGQTEAKAATGITPKLLTKENVMTALKFSIEAQMTGIKKYNDRCKVRNAEQDNGFPYVYATYPLINGPLDSLEKKVYDSQSRFWIEINNVREKLLRDPAKPYKAKMQLLLGGDVYNNIANDSTKKLWWYVNGQYGVFGNTDTDSLYREAYRSVCEYNNGRVYEDTHAGVDSTGAQDPNMFGRVRMQCGWKTPGECVVAANKWALDKGQSGGKYAEWYNWSDLMETDNVLKVPMNHPLRSTPGVTGACIITNSGIRQMCEVAKGSYNPTTHTCTFTKDFCQSIATCWDSVSQTCYLPTNAIKGVGVLFGDGAPREFIKIYGCNISGKDALNFIPPFSIFSNKGLEWFRDIAANKDNLNENFKTLLSSPAYAAGFATSAAGVGMFTVQTLGLVALSARVNVAIAVAMMAVIGVTIGVEYGDQNKTNGRFPTNDPNDYTIGGWHSDSSGTHIGPKTLGFAPGWVTKPLSLWAAGQYPRRNLTSFEDGLGDRLPGMFTCKFFDDQVKINDYRNLNAGNLSAGVDAYLFFTKWPRKVTCHTGCASSGGGNWVVQGYPKYGIRAGSNGSADKIWCLPPFPDSYYADSAIGPLATEDTRNNTNRTWTSGKAPTWAQYPTGEPGAPLSGTAFKGGESDSINQWKYQLVYKKDPSDAERVNPNSTWWNSTTNMPKKIWDTTYLRQYFTDSRIGEMRQYYCRIAFTGHIKDNKKPFDQLCYGYMSVDLEKYTVLPMTVMARTTRMTVARKCPTGQKEVAGGTCVACTPAEIVTIGGPCTTYCLAGQTMGIGGTCVPCPNGSYSSAGGLCAGCPGGQSSTNGGPCTNCPAGQYSVSGSACTPCGAGTYSSAGSSFCQPCGEGTYSSAIGATSCTACGAGTYSTTTGATSDTSCTPCGAGTYSTTTGATSDTLCTPCGAGTYSTTTGAVSCTPCPAGKSSTPGNTSCDITCSVNQYSTGGSPCQDCPSETPHSPPGSTSIAACEKCRDGTFNVNGVCTVLDCTPGTTYNRLGTLNAVAGEYPSGIICIGCPNGQYASGGICNKCPDGQSAPYTNNYTCTPCSAGTGTSQYSNGSCWACGFGLYPVNGICTYCSPGYTTTSATSSSCTPCAAGKYSVTTTASMASDPNGGSFSVYVAPSQVCSNCLTGKSSTSGSTSCGITCPAGQSSAGAGCTNCLVGQVSVSGGACTDCLAGTTSVAAGTVCTDCPTDTYKPAAGGSCTPCPANTSTNGVTAATSINQCQGCPAGTYSASGGYCLNCPAGQSSTSGGACTNCPAGQTSYGGGLCVNCPAGTSSNNGDKSCANCPSGKSSLSGGVCTDCIAGKYSTKGVIPNGLPWAESTWFPNRSTPVTFSTGQYTLVAGTTYTETGQLSYSTAYATMCGTCLAGRYSAAGSSSCSTCLAGQYSAAGSGSCSTCGAGTYSAAGSGSCSTCGVGTYSVAGSGSCTSCNAGTSSSATGATSIATCLPCGAGTYSDTAGSSSCTSCGAGRYSSATGATSSTTCTACAAGKYSSTVGATSIATCLTCPINTVSAPGSSSCAFACGAGSYATGPGTCTNCDAGKYSSTVGATSIATCLTCGAGTKSSAGSSSCTTCDSGQYSAAGSSSCTNCGPGKASSAGSGSCITCDAGQYSPGVSGSDLCGMCPAGTYSLVGSGSCTDCVAGKYSSNQGSGSCSTCLAGQFSNVKSTSCSTCGAGTYSAAGSGSCTNCLAGQYSAAGGGSCSTCGAGTYSVAASGSCTGCSPGTYSATAGSGSCTNCVAGKYSTTSNATSISTCLTCGADTYSVAGSRSCTTCGAGSYSLAGSSSCSEQNYTCMYWNTKTASSVPLSGVTIAAGGTEEACKRHCWLYSSCTYFTFQGAPYNYCKLYQGTVSYQGTTTAMNFCYKS